MINTILGVALALAVCVVIFAGAICWLADQEEKMKGEEDYPQDRPILKVTALKQEVDDGNEGDNKDKR